MYDLVCVGDTTLDTFLKIHNASLHFSLKNKCCEICFKYGEKISVEELRQNPGGNAANVAVGTATLGVKTALYAVMGDDDIGRNMKRMIAERGVDTQYLSINKGKKTNYSTILSFRGERTIFEMKYPSHLTFSTFPKTKWVYLSSLKQNPKGVYEPLVKMKKQRGFKIAFNPGMYQLTHSSRYMTTFLRHVDVLIVNKEEAKRVVSHIKGGESRIKNSTTPPLLRGGGNEGCLSSSFSLIHSMTNGLIFITDGERGAWGYDGQVVIHCKKFPSRRLVDRTGAGDAFSSGVVAGLIKGVSFPEVIRWGMANSAAVLGEIGPQNGLLNILKLKRILAEVKIFPDLREKSLNKS